MWLVTAAASWMAACLPALAAVSAEYRLAGVVAVGQEYIGLLEIRPGEQVLIRKGSEIPGGGRVTAFDGKTVRLALPGRMIELALDGSGTTTIATTGIVMGQEDVEHVHVRNVAVAPLREALLQQAPGGASSVDSIQRRGRSDAGAEVARRFAALVDLPARSRVVSVNEIPVTDAAAAIRLVDSTLADGMPARLNITAPAGGEQRVYLLPERD